MHVRSGSCVRCSFEFCTPVGRSRRLEPRTIIANLFGFAQVQAHHRHHPPNTAIPHSFTYVITTLITALHTPSGPPSTLDTWHISLHVRCSCTGAQQCLMRGAELGPRTTQPSAASQQPAASQHASPHCDLQHVKSSRNIFMSRHAATPSSVSSPSPRAIASATIPKRCRNL